MIDIPPPRGPRSLLPDGRDVEYDYTPATSEFDWRDYWKVVVRRRRLLIVVFLITVAFGAYFSLTGTRLYTATAILKIDPQNPTVTGVQSVSNAGEGSFDYVATQHLLLMSRRLATKVINELKLNSNESFTTISITDSSMKGRISSYIFGKINYFISLLEALAPGGNDPSKVPPTVKKDVQKPAPTGQKSEPQSGATQQPLEPKTSGWEGRYLSLLTVNPVKGTRLVEVKFDTPNPALSQLLANAHARAFIALNMETRQELTDEARQFLNEKNAELKKAVEQAEDKLNRFRQAHGVVSMEKGENVEVDRLVGLNNKLTEARTQRLDAESLKKTVENRPVQYLSQVITQGLVPSLRTTLQNLETERVKLSSTFKPDHPRMVELNQQIAEARRFLNAEIAHVVKGIEESYSAARAKEQALEAEAQKQQELALNMKQLGVEYAVLEEDVKVNRSLYESVLNRLYSTSVTNDLAMSNMQVIQLAEKPRSSSAPDRQRDILLAAALGLFLGLGLVFGLEYIDSTVNSPEQIWRAVSLSTLGVVPDLKSLKPLFAYDRSAGVALLSRITSLRLPVRSSVPGDSILEHHPLSVVAECYRTIRTALLFSQPEAAPQVILLTSPSPGEGKTVTTINLSVALAQDGYKVLIIDADLRKGCCHTRLGQSNQRGLSNILTGNIPLQEGIQQTSVSGLSLISRGVCPPNPCGLLGSNKMKQILASLRESFNFILIDCPPAIAVSDAAVISVNSDAVILVFNRQKTSTASARQAVESLQAVRAPILGAILNGVNISDPDYAYYRSYYGSDYGVAEENINSSSNGHTHPVGQSETLEVTLSSIELGPGMVPREFFEQMISKLSEATGPMAPLILRDKVADLRESLDAFPKSRLGELVEKLYEEILDENLRIAFQNAIAADVKSL